MPAMTGPADNDGPLLLGDFVRSRRNGQCGVVRGFRRSPRLGFRYVVVWETGPEGYSLVEPEELEVLERADARPPRDGSVA